MKRGKEKQKRKKKKKKEEPDQADSLQVQENIHKSITRFEDHNDLYEIDIPKAKTKKKKNHEVNEWKISNSLVTPALTKKTQVLSFYL